MLEKKRVGLHGHDEQRAVQTEMLSEKVLQHGVFKSLKKNDES